jgi:hypothetical protein
MGWNALERNMNDQRISVSGREFLNRPHMLIVVLFCKNKNKLLYRTQFYYNIKSLKLCILFFDDLITKNRIRRCVFTFREYNKNVVVLARISWPFTTFEECFKTVRIMHISNKTTFLFETAETISCNTRFHSRLTNRKCLFVRLCV